MSGLHSSSLCVEPDEASAVTECQHYTCSICVLFSCCDKHTLTGWARADRDGPACAKMHQNLLDVPGTVDEERSFKRVVYGKKIVGPVQNFLREPVARLAECNNPSNKCKDGSRTFLWTNGSAVPVDVLVNPINPAHSLVVFDQERLASVHPFPIISTIIWFFGLVI